MSTVDDDVLARQFEQHRSQLRAVAFRMLGSASEADDAVQDAWIRFARSDTDGVDNLAAWLTTVTSRVCLDMLRSRAARREEPLDERPVPTGDDPADDVALADAVGGALVVVLQHLDPAERVAFVLHDTFGVPFDDIAAIVRRSPAAARQLASRARRRVRGAGGTADRERNHAVVQAFRAASRSGDFAALLEVLDPDAVVRGDATAVGYGAEDVVRGRTAIAELYAGRAQAARSVLVDGLPGMAWTVRNEPRVVFDFTVVGGKIVTIDLIADPDVIAGMDLDFTRQ